MVNAIKFCFSIELTLLIAIFICRWIFKLKDLETTKSRFQKLSNIYMCNVLKGKIIDWTCINVEHDIFNVLLQVTFKCGTPLDAI